MTRKPLTLHEHEAIDELIRRPLRNLKRIGRGVTGLVRDLDGLIAYSRATDVRNYVSHEEPTIPTKGKLRTAATSGMLAVRTGVGSVIDFGRDLAESVVAEPDGDESLLDHSKEDAEQ